ncbi:MAG: hypothetical protein WDO73_26920 [Ignavibacteriota bacterium]
MTSGIALQTTSFHTDGSAALQVNVTGAGWFGASLASPADLSGRPSLSVDLLQVASGAQSNIAFQSGPGGIWCQGGFRPVPANTISTVTIPLDATQLTCYSERPLTPTSRAFGYG